MKAGGSGVREVREVRGVRGVPVREVRLIDDITKWLRRCAPIALIAPFKLMLSCYSRAA